ncbi:MAG: phasin family protein [Candidatus Contendobacter sp.]|nr:phasin family protein [Candidatus Contendobacter sp.]
MKAALLENQRTHNVQDFARQIWLAGLGAFAKTQQEGGRFFEALVQEGQAVDLQMKQIADAKALQMKSGVDVLKNKVEDLRGRATGTWNKLEEVFQARVAHALRRLGVPTRDDIQQLFQQVDRLSQNIQELTRAAEADAKDKKARIIKATGSAVTRIAEPVA